MTIQAEGAFNNYRIEFDRESTQGTPPSDPMWLLYSDTIRSFEWAPDSDIEITRGVGDADPSAFLKGPETHEVTIEYDLQEWIVDGSGNAKDASYDGIARNSNNKLPNSHTMVAREDKTSITAEETVNGSTSYATRIYTVGTGGLIDEVTLTGDPGSQQPVVASLTYQFEKVRSYQIDQMSSSQSLTMKTTDSGDTSQTVHVEDESASTTAKFSLNGTNLVTEDGGSAVNFSDIDAIEVKDGSGNRTDTTGDLKVYINTGSHASPTSGDQLAEIKGSSTYSNISGDSGIPELGTGSHASAIGTSFENVIGDSIESPASTNLAFDINSAEFSVSNNLESTSKIEDLNLRWHPGNRDATITATVLGESESHSLTRDHLTTTQNAVKWTMTGGSFQITNAPMTEPPTRTVEAGEATMSLDAGFQGDGIKIDGSAV